MSARVAAVLRVHGGSMAGLGAGVRMAVLTSALLCHATCCLCFFASFLKCLNFSFNRGSSLHRRSALPLQLLTIDRSRKAGTSDRKYEKNCRE